MNSYDSIYYWEFINETGNQIYNDLYLKIRYFYFSNQKKCSNFFFSFFLYIIVYINSNYKLYNIQNLKKFSSKILYTVNFCITLVLIISIKIIKNIVTTFVNNICRFSYNTYFPQRYFIILINKINNIF